MDAGAHRRDASSDLNPLALRERTVALTTGPRALLRATLALLGKTLTLQNETLAVIWQDALRIEIPNPLVRTSSALADETLAFRQGTGCSPKRRRFASQFRILSPMCRNDSKTRRLVS